MTARMLLLTGLCFTLPAVALASDDDRPEHFKGEASENLDQALANLGSYNRKLAALLAEESLSTAQLHEVHVLTYTLENALERIEEEVEAMAEDLEAVHVASEHADPDTVKSRGKAYLDASGKLAQ